MSDDGEQGRDVYEQLTQPARTAVERARDEARQLNDDHVGTEHLLLALAQGSDTLAMATLRDLGVTIDGVRYGIERTVPRAEGPVSGDPPFSDDLEQALEVAAREAEGRDDEHCGTEHLLIGLTQLPDSRGAALLAELAEGGLDGVRSVVDAALAGAGEAGAERATPDVDGDGRG